MSLSALTHPPTHPNPYGVTVEEALLGGSMLPAPFDILLISVDGKKVGDMHLRRAHSEAISLPPALGTMRLIARKMLYVRCVGQCLQSLHVDLHTSFL